MRGVAATLVFLFASTARAGDAPRGRWLRRITLAAACAARFWDAHNTAVAVRAGARETNPLFADPLGRPRWNTASGMATNKAGGIMTVQGSLVKINC